MKPWRWISPGCSLRRFEWLAVMALGVAMGCVVPLTAAEEEHARWSGLIVSGDHPGLPWRQPAVDAPPLHRAEDGWQWFCARLANQSTRLFEVQRTDRRRITRTLQPQSNTIAACRVPGEYEHQGGILLCVTEMVRECPALFGDIVSTLRGHTTVVVGVNDETDYQLARTELDRRGVPDDHLRFVLLPHDTMWVRDFGPAVTLGDDRRPAIVDSMYDRPDRPIDEDVPTELATRASIDVRRTEFVIEGGNFLTNGRGLAIATKELFALNRELGFGRQQVVDMLAEQLGVKELVELEPLDGEPNGHVDMFATFTSYDTVVVASVDPNVDRPNAEILNRNAARLARVIGPGGRPLRVRRIPMPPRGFDDWPSYTNVIYGNGTLLVPAYPGRDTIGFRKAVTTYKRLLPGWQVIGIDARPLSELYGGLHCVSMNLGPIDAAKLPRIDPRLQ